MKYVLKRRIIHVLSVIIMTLSLTACVSTLASKTVGSAPVTPTVAKTETRPTMQPSQTATSQPKLSPRPWSSVHNWVYWLDNPDLKQIAATGSELAVIDYSADGSGAKAFTAAQIASLRQSGCQRRVLSYLSIGQAESYRWYWQKGWRTGDPDWLGAADPGWAQNYWVNYWRPAWQQVIYHYLDAIIAAGFDGVYLDRIDAYEESYANGHEDDMVQFVTNIAQYARSHSPLKEDFGIFVQNAEDLATDHPDYVQLVTGIGREEVYIQATNRPTSESARMTIERNLNYFQQHSRGKLVLLVDYANRPEMVHTAYQRAQAKGYIPYVTDVGLGRLQINPGYEPICHPVQ